MSAVISYREATIEDTPLVLNFIKRLAEYEKLLHEVEVTEAQIQSSLFSAEPRAFCTIAEIDNKPAGFAICFYNYSTFLGKSGVYIEDLYVEEEFRGRGIGKGFFKYLAQKAMDENCGRIEWAVLDWNEPSIEFYKEMGGKPMNEWIVYRLEGQTIQNVAKAA